MTGARPNTWMPFYWADYRADTSHLSAIEHGGYILLIGHYWTTGQPLPMNDAQLARIAAMSPAEWKKHSRPILAFFTMRDGIWVHGRIERELEQAAIGYTKRAEAANKRWSKHNASLAEASSNADAMHEQPTTTTTVEKKEPPLVPPAGGNPKERSVVRRNKTRIPDGWCFDPTARQIFLDAGISYSLEQPAFRDHHAAAGSLFLDWNAAGRKWARNAVKYAAERSGNQRQRTGPSRAVGLAEAMADVLATGAGKAQRAGDPGCSGARDSAMPASGGEPGTQWDGPSIDVVDLGGGAFGVPTGRGDDSPQDVGEDREMVADTGGDPIGVHVAGGAPETNAPNASGLAGIVVPIPVFLRRG